MEKKVLNVDCPYKDFSCSPEQCSCAKYKAWRKASNEHTVNEKLNELGIDTNLDLLSLVFVMQKQFISKFHKVDNLTNDEMEYWVDKYLVCIDDEVGEAREHLNYFSDNLLSNNKEFLKEIIDILHFVVNLFIVGNCDSNIIKEKYLSLYNENVKDVYDIFIYAFKEQKDGLSCVESIEYIKDKLNNDLFNDNLSLDNQYYNASTNINMLILLSNLLDVCGKIRQNINWKFWKSNNKVIDLNELHKCFAELFHSLINIFVAIDCKPDKIKKIYITKNLENIFRQELNY